MLYSYIKGLQFSVTNDCLYKMGLLCFCPVFFTRHRFFFCTELLYKNVFAVFLLFLFQRGRLQFKRFLIIWEINNCVRFVSLSRMLSARWSFPADYSNYACDLHAFRTQGVSYNSSKFECRLSWSDQTFKSHEGRFSVYAVLTHKHWSGFVGFAYLLFGTKTAIAVKYLFYCSRNICQGIKDIRKMRG